MLSLSLLTKLGCYFYIDEFGIKVSRNFLPFASSSFVNDYIQLHCSLSEKEILLVDNNVNNQNNLNTEINVKRAKINEKSAYLWHRRPGHISKERLFILVKQNIL